MTLISPTKMAPLLAAALLALAPLACGDDESDDGSTAPVDLSIPTETTPPADSERTTTAPNAGNQQQATEEIEGVEKIKGPTETIPGVGVIPKPTAKQRQQIARCVAAAEGDPNKLAKCGQIVVR